MSFHNDFRRALLIQNNTDTRRYTTIEKAPTETSDDMLLFYESMFKKYHSDYALNEYSRVKHMLLKTSLDSVP